MKLTDFVKKYGIDRAKKLLAITGKMNMSGLVFVSLKDGDNLDFEVNDLKRLIESHDLIINLGGLDKAKRIINSVPKCLKFYSDSDDLMFHLNSERFIQFSCGVSYAKLGSDFLVPMYGNSAYKLKKDCIPMKEIKQAIADVESCK